MRVLGIDPGATVTAWGVVERHRGRYRLVAAGHVRTRASQPMSQRLDAIYTELDTALRTHRPDAVSIEAVFKHKSSASALVLGQARGVALLAAGRAGYEPHEYNAMTVKRSVGAHGRADKAAVGRMVGMLLGEVPEGPADIADALAIAITHCAHAHSPERTR